MNFAVSGLFKSCIFKTYFQKVPQTLAISILLCFQLSLLPSSAALHSGIVTAKDLSLKHRTLSGNRDMLLGLWPG